MRALSLLGGKIKVNPKPSMKEVEGPKLRSLRLGEVRKSCRGYGEAAPGWVWRWVWGFGFGSKS